MPAEWEAHEAVWLAWPWDPDYFGSIEEVEPAFVNVIEALHGSERVELFVLNEKTMRHVQQLLPHTDHVQFHIEDYADVWFRDFGPTFVKDGNGELIMVNWTYNGYGKFPELLKDDRIPSLMNTALKLPSFQPRMVFEGGSIDVNGNGTLLTTEECVLNPNRNPDFSKKQVEQRFKEYLGVQKTIWLSHGLVNDQTDGHVDNIARFVNNMTILCCYEPDPSKSNYDRLQENWKRLEEATDKDGKPFTLVKLPLPEQYDKKKDEWMAVSYANFYIGNTVVLVPTFRHPNDGKALGIIASAFPERQVVGINSTRLALGGGTIHCISQQQPRI